ncbi:lasso RiPP family leader peptide-containing protein [Streptomyces minutiscleroticus]|uniref:Uncharacterized protein n=1 Tax=Streptomyces minutiscleroticus TaxID=68238 RepID=A0A918NAN6_9ACTN|nr:lasso RiPP family leader peptide-containing protein [Streptomyces minutiscleroticus]GGX58770.1 hypothetical protein GCM10010358_11090 [Streptomyces minutiscleroticus]
MDPIENRTVRTASEPVDGPTAYEPPRAVEAGDFHALTRGWSATSEADVIAGFSGDAG